jgi:hypothetical protein
MFSRCRRHPLLMFMSCLFGVMLLAAAWPRTAHSSDLPRLSSIAHSVVAISDDGQGAKDDDVSASLTLEDNCGMDDILHEPAELGLGLVPAGSGVLAMHSYAVRQRDIVLLLRPPEAA